jgi:probable F420-dependent oxidoreductase
MPMSGYTEIRGYRGWVARMDLGVVAGLTDLDLGMAEVAQMVEQAGLESLWMFERTHLPVSRREILDEGHSQDPRFLDQFVALGAAAAVTSELKLGTSVCVVPQHAPILLAKRVATLDHLSGGRFLFGVGVGWLEEEMRNHGVDPPQRWAMMREHLLAMREIWGHEEAEFHGTYVDFDPIMMWPKPRAPLLIAAWGPQTLRMVAELGDGWLPVLDDLEQLEEFDARLAVLTEACHEFGRDPVEVSVGLHEIDERLLDACAERGVRRCFIVTGLGHSATLNRDRAQLEPFLENCARVSRNYG